MNRRDVLRLMALAAAGCGSPEADALASLTASPERKHARMATRPIPSTGEELEVIGLGTWQTFDVSSATPPLAEVMREFVALGGRLVDSSPMYGRSETVVGDVATTLGLTQQLFLATKVWTSGEGQGIAQMSESMRRLRRKKLDLMQVHNLVDMKTHLRTLREWKADGTIRYVGITHYTSSAYPEVEAAMKTEQVDFLQINYSALEREAEKRLLPLARERGIAVIANRPFAEGALLRRLGGKPLPSFAGEIGCASWAQLLLKFVLSHPAITCTIPATSKVRHLRENMAAGSGLLPDASMRKRIVEAL